MIEFISRKKTCWVVLSIFYPKKFKMAAQLNMTDSLVTELLYEIFSFFLINYNPIDRKIVPMEIQDGGEYLQMFAIEIKQILLKKFHRHFDF
jgi:hypothetical protein